MKEYLSEILREKKRVIIPNLGSFIAKEDGDQRIVFNEFLKYNDGVLVSFVAEKEGIDKEEAERKVNLFSKRALTDLNAGKQITFDGLGSLAKDKIGKITFINSTDPEIESKKSDLAEESIIEEENQKVESKLETEPEVVQSTPDDSMNSKVKIEENIQTNTTGKVTTINTSMESEKKRSKAWIFIVLIALIALVIWIIYFAPPISSILGGNSKNQIIPDTNIFMPDTTAQLIDSVEVEPVVTVPVKKYYIIAGCFQTEKNADNYVNILKSNGYNAEKFGTYNSLHAVSFDSFESMQEAQKTLIKIRRSVEPKAWVLYY